MSDAERRPELIDAALRVIRRQGPDVSMDAIAAEAGVTKPILYRHYAGRAGLCEAIAQRVFVDLVDATRKAFTDHDPGPELIAAAMDPYLAFIDGDTHVYRFLCITDLGREGAIAVGAAFAGVLADALVGYGAPREAASAWAHGMVGMVEHAGDWWLEAGRPMPRRDLAFLLAGLLWNGFDKLGGNW